MLYRMFQTATNSIISQTIDIRQDDSIVGLWFGIEAINTGAAVSSGYIELSFLSGSQEFVNDTTGVIATIPISTPTAVINTGLIIAESLVLPGIPITSGERLFLHLRAGTGMMMEVYVHVITAKGDSARAVRRR